MVQFQKLTKKFISHLTRAQPTPSAAATVQVSHALPAVRSLVLTAGLRDQFPRWRRSRKTLCVLRFEVPRSVITVQPEFRAAWFRKEAPCMVRLF